MPMGFVAAAMVAGQVVSSTMQADAAGQAASQYANSANKGLAQNQAMFDVVNAQSAPYRAAGEKGANLYSGLADSGYLTAQPTMNDLTTLMPNYKFNLQQGMGQFMSGVNASGGAVSGNAIQGGQQYAQDYAGNSLQNAFANYQTNRSNVVSNVNALTGVGQQANATTAGAASGTALNASNLLSSIGNAQAAGTMGQANAYAGGINNLSNYAMLYGLKKAQ